MAEETIEQLAERAAKGEILNTIEQQRLALYIKENEEQKKSLEFQKQRTEEIKRELELLNKKENIEEASQKSKQAELSLRKNQLEIEKQLLELRKLEKDINEAQIELDAAKKKQDDEEIKAAQEKLDLANKNFDTLNRYIEKKKEQDRFEKAGVDNAINGLNALGIRTEEQDNSMTKMFRGLMRGGEDAESVLTGMGNGFKKLNVENVAISLLSKTVESTIMMVKMADTTFASFNKTIGTTGELNNEIYELSAGNAQLGFTLQETAQSYTALAGGFVDFRGLSQQNRQELAQTVTELQAIGISADLATKNISFFSKAMGLSTEQSISLSKELVAVAGALEMAPSKIASDFAAAASTLVVYGNRGIEVFKGLEAASKASGVEISNLISIASKMDTFQGAAEAAGKLNAVLGGGLLNSSQLLMASEEERVRLVIESVQSQGVQFNDLDKYTQKAIANAAGITDMAEANKIFGMSLDSYDNYIAKTALSSEEQANLEERIQASKSAQEKLNYIMQSFAVLVIPILDAVTGLVNVFMKLNDITGGVLPQLITLGFVMFKSIGWAISFGEWLMALIPGTGALATAVTTLGNAIATTAAGIASLGTGPILLIITIFLSSILFVYKAFYDTNSELYKFMKNHEILATIVKNVFGVFYSFVSVIMDLKNGTLTLSKAFDYFLYALKGSNPIILLIIGGFQAVRYASEQLAKFMYELLSPIINNVFDKIITGFTRFSNVITSLAIPALNILMAPLRIVGSIMSDVWNIISSKRYILTDQMSAGFAKFANVITSLAIPALNMFLAPLKIIGSIMSGVWSGISTIVGATSALFGKDNVVGIKANFDTTETLSKTAAKITPETVSNVKQLTAEVQKFNMELQGMATVTAAEPLERIAKAIAEQANAMLADTGQTIILKVGDLEMGRVVGNFLNRKGNIDTVVKSTSTIT